MDNLAEIFPFSVMARGGLLMWPILFCSLVAIAIVIERFISLRRARIDTREFMATIRTVLSAGRIDEAIRICDDTEGPVARILKAGLLKHGRRKEEIREAIEDAAVLELPLLERYLGSLATIVQISPLLGLLGTVYGMIKAFARIQQHAGLGPVSPSMLAEGIHNALYTTAAGLTVAIPALICYNYLVNMVNEMMVEMEITSAELVDLLAESSERE